MTLYRSLSVDLPVEMCSRTAATAVSRSNNNNNNNNNKNDHSHVTLMFLTLQPWTLVLQFLDRNASLEAPHRQVHHGLIVFFLFCSVVSAQKRWPCPLGGSKGARTP